MRHDVRLAIRALAQHKGFAAAALLTFALGIGANAAMFSVVYGVLLRPLPYDEPERLVRLSERHPGANAPVPGRWLSNLTYTAWSPAATTIGPIATYGSRTVTVGTDDPARVAAASATPALFDVLRVSPQVGRFFTADDAADGAAPVAILSDGFWRERYGGAVDAAGKILVIDGQPHRVIGVAPPGFRFPDADTRLWTPTSVRPPGTGNNVRISILSAIARLAPGATPEHASAEGTAAARREPRPFVAEMMFGKGGPVEVQVQTMVDEMTAGVRPALVVLMAAVGCLMLIACANVANLLLSRGISRERELAIRVAVGATSGRLLRQVLAESLVIAVGGGLLGLACAYGLIQVLPALAPDDFPRLDQVRLDWRVAGFAFAVSVLAGLLSGIVPALRGARPSLLPALREGVGASQGVRTARVRRALLVAEAAVAVVLLVGSALLVRSFIRLVQVDPGYDAANVMTARIYLPGASVGKADTTTFLDELLPRVRQLPGVVAAGAGNMAPLGDSTYITGFTLPQPGREPVTARGLAYWVTPGYAEALQLRLRVGRALGEDDATAGVQAMMVNEEFVRTFLAGVNPVGLTFPSILGEKTTAQIVGVLANTLKDGLDVAPQPEVYVAARAGYAIRREINLVVRTSGDPSASIAPVRQLVRDLRRDAAVDDVETLAAQVSASAAQPRFAAAVLATFAGLALLLAAVGLYGVISYTVSKRQREIGVRAALGASRGAIVRLIVRDGMTAAAAGLALGVVAAFAVTRWLDAMLFGVTALDPVSFGLGPVLLLLVAIVACWLPARRAAATHPATALRHD